MYRGSYASPYPAPDWTRLYAPHRCKKCGQPVAQADAPDVVRQMTDAYNALYGPLMSNLAQWWGGAAAPAGTARPAGPGVPAPVAGQEPHHRHHHGHRHGCCEPGCCEPGCCEGCHCCDCHCRCCVYDADLLIQARLGESRVVSLTIENPRRREREVKLELSNWTTRSGSPASVHGRIVEPTAFTLGPCSEHDVILLVESGIKPAENAPNQPEGAANQPPARIEGRLGIEEAAAGDAPGRQLPDVQQCDVFYADLRIEGCDTRPVRIALALLPRDCGSHPIDCGCGCC